MMNIRSRVSLAFWCLVPPFLLVLFLIGAVDRPWSTFAHEALHGIKPFDWMTMIAAQVEPLAVLGLAVIGVAAVLGWRPGPVGKVLLACCLAAVIAGAAKEELKYVFGRTWPETWINNNPSWITDKIFAFQPFHGGRGFASFPSGHMAMITAPMTVLWRSMPRLFWLWIIPVLMVAVGLLGMDYHWPSDVVAGAWVGWVAGIGALALVRR